MTFTNILLVVFSLSLLPCTAGAGDCPDFFRFADFGLQDAEGSFSRGGPLYRGESFEGRSLLLREKTECRAVRDIGSDGHGNPIPVVTRIAYDVESADLDLIELDVFYSDNIQVMATQNAQLHHARLAHHDSDPIRGQSSLCVPDPDGLGLSCQLVSPYPSDVGLIVHCDQRQCIMPVLAVNANIVLSATWPVTENFWAEPQNAGPRVFAKVQRIHAFIEPLSSGL